MIVLGIITARGGSKGIPKKNIKPLGGKPLIAYTIDSAKKSKILSHTIVSTDDVDIAKIAERYGGQVPFIRPEYLAKDDTKHLPVVQHAIEFFEKENKVKVDYVLILQPTSPFRTPEDIDGTIDKLISTGADSAVSLVELTENHPIKIKRLENDRVYPYSINEDEGIRRQDLPKAYKRSGAAYAMRRETIMDKNSFYGDHIVGYIVPNDRSIDIDTNYDWIKAEYMLQDLKSKGYEF